MDSHQLKIMPKESGCQAEKAMRKPCPGKWLGEGLAENGQPPIESPTGGNIRDSHQLKKEPKKAEK